MISKMPKVTVLLTSYNHEKYIEKSIRSVLNQTFADFELLIVDDCSTDNSLSIIRSFKDPRVRIIEHSENLKKALTYELIDKEMNGNYIAIHHSDDTWEADKLELQVNFLEENQDYAACFTNVNFIDEYDEIYELPEGHIYKNIFETENKNRFMWLNEFFYNGNCLCHPSILIRKTAYRDFSMLDKNGFAQLPDFRMWVKLAMHGEIYVLPERLTNFRYRRLNQSNMSSDRVDSKIRSSIETLFILNDFKEYASNSEIIKIFPDAEHMIINGKYNGLYVLAQKCLEVDSQVYKLFGLQILFDILNDKKNSIEVKELYDFSYIDFYALTNRFDVFGITKRMTVLNSSLYLDYGNGFSESDKLKKFITVQSSGEFIAEFDLNELNANESIINVRFDPDEGKLWDIRIDYVNIGNISVDFNAGNSFISDRKYDIFLTTDPFYYISSENGYSERMTIKGKIKQLSGERIYDEFRLIKEQSDYYLQRLQISDEWLDIVRKTQSTLEILLADYQRRIEELNGELLQCNDSINVLNETLKDKEEIIQDLERTQLLINSENKGLNESITLRDKQIVNLTESNNQLLNDLEESNSDLDLAKQENILLSQKLNDLEIHLNRIHSTRVWKLYVIFKKVLIKIGVKRSN